MLQQTQQNLPLWSFQFKADAKLEMFTRQDLERQLLKKSWEDKSFKAEFLSNPKAAIQGAFEIQLPEALQIEVMEETEEVIYMVLPHNPYSGTPESELKQAVGMDLEEIALLTTEPMKGATNGASLIAKAWRDAQFAEQLVANPAATLATELGLDIREGVAVQVLVETADKVYIVMPFFPDYELMEAESDLMTVNLPIVIGSAGATGGLTFNGACLNTTSTHCRP